MKKSTLFVVCMLLAGCAGQSQTVATTGTSNASIRSRMQSCMLLEAQNKFQAGTLFMKSMSDTADELVSVCAQKLALESMGISNESKTAAEGIISNLQALTGNR